LAELEGYGFWGGRITEGGRITDMEDVVCQFIETFFFSSGELGVVFSFFFCTYFQRSKCFKQILQTKKNKIILKLEKFFSALKQNFLQK
jgi:uncharacterized membrane protein